MLAVNGFEQLMINYANDKLQYFFTQTAISLVLAEYREQRIDAAILLGSFHDIAPTLALVEGAPEGDDLLAISISSSISAGSSFGRGPARSTSFGINRKSPSAKEAASVAPRRHTEQPVHMHLACISPISRLYLP